MNRLKQTRRIVKRTLTCVSLVLFVVFGVISFSYLKQSDVKAADNNYLNFQARILQSSGAVVADGTYNVEFKLYNAASSSGSSQGSCAGDANCLWVETRTTTNRVVTKNGYITASLGSISSFPSTIQWDQELWISLNIGGINVSPSWDGEMNPRMKVTSVPLAFSAQQLQKSSGAYTTKLTVTTPTADRSIVLPNESGTVCTTGSVCSGYQASGSFVNLQATTPGSQQTGHINVSGTGIFGTNLLSPIVYGSSSANGTLTLQGNSTTGNTATNANLIFKVSDSGGTTAMTILNNGNVGIGDISPASLLTVGNGDLFQVNSSGAIAAAAGINSSGTITFSGLTASRAVFTNASSELTTSSNSTALLNTLTDETGSGVAVFGTSPTFTTSITTPITYGSSIANGTLVLQGNYASSGNTNTNANIQLKVGDSGATTAMTILNNGNVGIGDATPASLLTVKKTSSFDYVYVNSNGVWSNNTSEAAISAGTAFTLQQHNATYPTTDFGYVGEATTFSNIYMDISTASSVVTYVYQYSKGGGSWGTLTVTDGTTGMTVDGNISFTPPGDWATDTVNGSTGYWVRWYTVTNPGTHPAAYLVVPESKDTVNIFANANDTLPAIYVSENGRVGIGTNADATIGNNQLYVTGSQGISNNLTVGGNAVASSYIQSNIATLYLVSTDGLVASESSASTAAIPSRISPRLRLTARAWDIDGAASNTVNFNSEVIGYSNNTVGGRQTWAYDLNGAGYQELMNLTSAGDLNVFGTTFGSEILANNALTSGTSWARTGDFALSSNTAVYTHSSGAGTLTQVSGSFASTPTGSRWYKFTYTVSGVGTAGAVQAQITTSFGETLTNLNITANGTYTTYFKATGSPSDFVISATSATGGAFTLDELYLKEMQGGNVVANGLITGGGTTGIKVLASGNVGIGTLTPGGTLSVVSGNTTGTTTSSGLNLSVNSLTTGTGLYAASSSLTSGILMDLQVSGTAAAASQKALNILTTGTNATSSITTYGGYISNTHDGTTSTNVGLYLNTTGGTTANYGVEIGAMSGATSTAINIGAFTGATANTGINIGNMSTATTSKGIVIGTNSSATATAIDIGALSGTTSIGVNVANSTGATTTGLKIGTLTGATADTGIDIGNLSTGATVTGIKLGTLTAGAGGAVRGLQMGALTAVATANNMSIDLGAITTVASATAYGINTGGFTAAAGTATYGINLGTNASTATTNYGIKIGAISGAGTTNYGIYVDTVSNAAYNYAAVFAGGKVGIGITNPYNKLHVEETAVTDTAEVMARFSVSDNATNYLFIGNVSSENNHFAPGISGINATDTDYAALTLDGNIDSSVDSGGLAVVQVVGRKSGTQLANRSIFGVSNIGSNLFNIEHDGYRKESNTGGSGMTWQVGPNYYGTSHSYTVYNNSGTGVYLPSGNTAWSANSDRRLKTNIQTISNEQGLEAIIKLNPVTFNWLSADAEQSLQAGFIAQDVQQIFPGLVSNAPTTFVTLSDGTRQEIIDPLGVNYTGFVPFIIKGIQEQQVEIEDLDTEISMVAQGITTVQQFINAAGDANFSNLQVSGVATIKELKVTEVATLNILEVTGPAEFGGDLQLAAKVNTKQAITKKFYASKPIAAGSVVVIDNTKDGYVTTTGVVGDTRIIGVTVKEALAEGDEIEVAIGGNVQVQVDKFTAVASGDMVVADDQDGIATVTTTPTVGSLLGKATSAKDINNLVWILITLQ